MKPSAKKRDFYLKIGSFKVIEQSFFWGCLIMITLISIFLYFFQRESFSNPLVYLIFGVFIILFCVVMPFVFFPLARKEVMKGIVLPEPKIENRISFHELCEACKEINEADNPYVAEPHEDEGWIDITWNWKDSIDFYNSKINKNKEVFYTCYKIYDDYTYETLDIQKSSYFMISKKGLGGSYSINIGHLAHTEYIINVSSNKENGLGIHEYKLKTVDMTNYMHAWLAEHGYRYRGL